MMPAGLFYDCAGERMTIEQMIVNAILVFAWIGTMLWLTHDQKDDTKQTRNLRRWARYVTTATLLAGCLLGGLLLFSLHTQPTTVPEPQAPSVFDRAQKYD